MNTFKLLALVAGLAFITANVSAQASAQPDPQQAAQKQTDRIKQNVTGITSDQGSQILAVELDFTKNVQGVLSSTDPSDKAAIHNKIKPLRDTRDTKIKTILTADQYSQYEKSKPEYQGGK